MADDNVNMPQGSPQQPGGNKSNTSLTVGIIIIIIAAIAYFALRGRSTKPASDDLKSGATTTETRQAPTETRQAPQTPEAAPPAAPDGSMSTGAQVKSFTVTGQPFSFTPAEIKVKKGDTVKINFVNANGTHNFVIDEFNARIANLQTGQSQEIQFVADKTGTFEYYCSVGNHRAMGMKGNLIVE